MIIRFIILGILVFLLFRILRSLFLPPASPRSRIFSAGEKMVVNDMVQDPHCGVYVARKEAYSTRRGDEVLYFCSEECCKKYLQKNESV